MAPHLLPFCKLDLATAAAVLATQSHVSRAVKSAAVGDVLSQIRDGVGSFAKNVADPTASASPAQWEAARNALIGSGVGAVGGGILGARKKRPNILGNALSGALLGGTVGGAGTLGIQALTGEGGLFGKPLPGEQARLDSDKAVADANTAATAPDATLGDRATAVGKNLDTDNYLPALNVAVGDKSRAAAGALAGGAAGMGIQGLTNQLTRANRIEGAQLTAQPPLAKNLDITPQNRTWHRGAFGVGSTHRNVPRSSVAQGLRGLSGGRKRVAGAYGAALGGVLGGHGGAMLNSIFGQQAPPAPPQP